MRGASVIGIDPGFAKIGYAVAHIRPLKVVALGTVETKKGEPPVSEDNFKRVRDIYCELAGLCYAHRPATLCIEAMSYPRNASTAAKMSLCWGALAALSEEWELDVLQATPREIKIAATCDPKATKEDVQAALADFPGYTDLIAEIPKTKREHPSDALGAILANLEEIHI